MRVALINPYVTSPTHGRKKGEQLVYNYKMPPLELAYIAGLLEKKGVEVALLDANIEQMPAFEAAGKVAGCDIIFVATAPYYQWQCPALHFDYVMDYVRPLKAANPSAKLYVFGPNVNLDPQYFLEGGFVDAVILGEPEQKAVGLCFSNKQDVPSVAWMENGRYTVSAKKEKPIELDSLFPSYRGLPIHKYEYQFLGRPTCVLETSRGCPYQCTFCFKDMVGSLYRTKSVPRVMEEISYVVGELGVKNIFFHDSEMTVQRKRTVELCKAIIDSGMKISWACQSRADTVDGELLKLMKDAGCRLICFGIESGSDELLEKVKKGITVADLRRGVEATSRAGIETAGFFIIGLPEDTRQAIQKTVDLAKSLPFDYVTFQIMTPYPNTPVYDQYRERFKERFPKAFTLNFTQDELEAIKKKAFMQFYLRPSYFAKVFGKFLKEPVMVAKKFLVFLDYL